MDKHSNNNQSNNNNQFGTKVRSIDELLAAKRASNKLGNDQAAKASQRATNAVRGNAGKAKRSQLRNDLVKSAQLAQAQGEEEGIKQFLSEDIPTVMNALNSELRSSHIAAMETNERRLIESAGGGAVVDVEWSDYASEYDMSFETEEWGSSFAAIEGASLRAQGGANTSTLREASQPKLEGSNKEDNFFNVGKLPD